jgi:hypothetical protein
MFKKNAWIVGLLMGLAIMFVGCVDSFVDEDGDPTEVFNLQSLIAGLPAGPIDNDAAWNAIFDGTPFMMCGGPSNGDYSLIVEKGVTKVKVDNMGPTWGVGFDLYNDKGANFKDGDEFYIKGKSSAGGLIANITTGGEKRLGDVDLAESAGDFEQTLTLAAGNAGSIRTGSPKAIRIHYKNNNGSERKGSIIIEELTLNGKRKAGEGALPPVEEVDDDDYEIPEVYEIPTTGLVGDQFYLNLNAHLTVSPEIGNNDGEKAGSLVIPTKTLHTNDITIEFTKINQRVIFKFSEEQLEKIADGGGAKVTIDGSVTVSGSSATDSFRYHIGDGKTTSNWNASTGNGASAFAILAAENQQSFTTNYKEPKSIRHFIFNYRGNDATGGDKVTVVINSIKFEPIPAKVAELNIGADKLPAPVAGKEAKTSVETDGFNGKVIWTPELNSKKRFELSTIYTAKIVLTPKPGYSLPIELPGTAPTVSGVTAFFNPETRTLTTANFPRTDSKYPPLPTGVFWKMTEWLVDATASKPVDHNGNNLWDSRPFQFNDYTPRMDIGVDTTAKTVTIPASARDAAYKGIDIYLTDSEFGNGALDPSIYKVEVTVKGKVTSTGSAVPFNFVVEESDGPDYRKVIEKKDLNLPVSGDFAFDYTAEIPENFNISHKLRIHPSVANVGFVLTEVSFENKGLR